MKAQYTGRWAVTEDGCDVVDNNRSVAFVGGASRLQVRANAMLISAAPEMLRALVSVLASVPFADYRGDGELEECEQLVRDAIEKATRLA